MMVLNLADGEFFGTIFGTRNEISVYQTIEGEKFREYDVVVGGGDGSDTDSISEAIKMLGTSGGSIFIKAGEYVLNSSITFDKNNIHLIGSGVGTKLIWAGAGTAIVFGTNQGCSISNLWIHSTAINSNIGVDLTGSLYSNVHDCWIDAFTTGIDLNNSGGELYTFVKSMFIFQCTTGIDATNCKTAIINGNRCWFNATGILANAGCSQLTITGNECIDNTVTGINTGALVLDMGHNMTS